MRHANQSIDIIPSSFTHCLLVHIQSTRVGSKSKEEKQSIEHHIYTGNMDKTCIEDKMLSGMRFVYTCITDI